MAAGVRTSAVSPGGGGGGGGKTSRTTGEPRRHSRLRLCVCVPGSRAAKLHPAKHRVITPLRRTGNWKRGLRGEYGAFTHKRVIFLPNTRCAPPCFVTASTCERCVRVRPRLTPKWGNYTFPGVSDAFVTVHLLTGRNSD